MMITHYLKVAFRNLWKYKTQHLIALAGVGVALLCFSICLYLVRYAFSMNHCFANYERIAELNIRDMKEEKVLDCTPATLAEELRLQKPDGIEALCVVDYSPIERPFNVEMPDGKQLPYSFAVAETDSSFFQVLTPKILCGSAEVSKMMPNSLVVSESMARRVYGDIRQAVGKQLVLMRRLYTSPDSTPRTGGAVYTIQAVIEDIPENNSIAFMKHLDMFSSTIRKESSRMMPVMPLSVPLRMRCCVRVLLRSNSMSGFIVVNRRIGCMIQVLRWKLI